MFLFFFFLPYSFNSNTFILDARSWHSYRRNKVAQDKRWMLYSLVMLMRRGRGWRCGDSSISVYITADKNGKTLNLYLAYGLYRMVVGMLTRNLHCSLLVVPGRTYPGVATTMKQNLLKGSGKKSIKNRKVYSVKHFSIY